MKKLVILAALLLLVPAASSAQGLKMTQSTFNKAGTTSISGNLLTFNNVKDDDADEGPTSMGLNPTIGYMAMDNLQINFGLGYGSSENGDSTASVWAVSPGVRYYLDMLSKNNLFPSVGLTYTMGSMTADLTGNDESSTDMSEIRVGAGITQAMGGAQGGYMTLNIDYSMQTSKPDTDGAEESNSSGIDVGVAFGLYF